MLIWHIKYVFLPQSVFFFFIWRKAVNVFWTIVTVTHVSEILQAGCGQDSCPLKTAELHGYFWKPPNQVTFTVTAAQHGGLPGILAQFYCRSSASLQTHWLDKPNSWQCGSRDKPLQRSDKGFMRKRLTASKCSSIATLSWAYLSLISPSLFLSHSLVLLAYLFQTIINYPAQSTLFVLHSHQMINP